MSNSTIYAPSNRIVYPPRNEWESLRASLTHGEKKVLELFDEKLDPKWEIYIQPHMNGLRPDFVLLNPEVGIAVFEVKDWDLDRMSYRLKDKCLEGRTNSHWFRLPNPVEQIRMYKDEISQLYCPRLDSNNGLAVITAGLIFTVADTDRIVKLLDPSFTESERQFRESYHPVAGGDALSSGNINLIFPEGKRRSSRLMSKNYADDIRGWLVEPDMSSRQRRKLKLDSRQQELAKTRTETGYRRIKGPAGSGKTLVLAARAAELLNQGKSVTVLTYNITLWHSIRDLIVRNLVLPGASKNLTMMHFHRWCKRVCVRNGFQSEYDALFSPKPNDLNHVLNVAIPELTNQVLDVIEATQSKWKTDALIVDEGQDMHLSWWNVMRRTVSTDGEWVLAADKTQDLYGTAKAWTDESMRGAGFRGKWSELENTYRLPQKITSIAADFATEFLEKDIIDLPRGETGQLDLGHLDFVWVQDSRGNASIRCVNAITALMHKAGSDGLANADIVFITDSKATGRDVVEELRKKRIAVSDTFSEDTRISRKEKMAFWLGNPTVKATTVHSFKGFESRLIVLHISQTGHAEDLGAIFVGLTRLKEDPRGSALYVVCSDSYLSEFGRKSAGNRYEESTLYKEELAKEAKLQKDAAEIVAKLFENP